MSLAAILALLDSARADFNTAVAAYAQGNFTAAFQDFLELAKQGDVMAQDIVAFMYHRGNGVKKDDVQAYMWLDLAARGGDPDAARFRDELIAPGMKPTEIAKAKELFKSSSLHGENAAGLPSPAEAQASAKTEAAPASAGSVKEEAAPASAAKAAPIETASVPPMQITPKAPREKPLEAPKPEEQAPSTQAAQPQPSQAASAQIEQPPPSEAQPSPPSSEARQSSPPPQPSPPVKVTPERIALAKAPDASAAPSRAPIESEAAQQSPERGWTVQLAAVQGEPQAQREWERLKQAHPDLLSELTPTFERFEIGDKHEAVYRVRVGSWKNVKAPIALCNKLKEKGERCFVARRTS